MTRPCGLADELEKKPCVTRYRFLIVSKVVTAQVIWPTDTVAGTRL